MERMSETPAQRYDRRAQAFADTIAGVPADRWDAQTPCEDWKAIDVVRHVVDTTPMFFGFVGEQLGDVPPVEDDPAAAFGAVRSAVLGALGDPAIADKEFDGAMGRNTFAGAVDQFLSVDLVVHRWDLARAVGADDTIPAEDVAMLSEAIKGFPSEGMRGPGAFGPELTPPPGADEQTKLLAFHGREA
jgi:uncharacterized protein (TIGR03086 family)